MRLCPRARDWRFRPLFSMSRTQSNLAGSVGLARPRFLGCFAPPSELLKIMLRQVLVALRVNDAGGLEAAVLVTASVDDAAEAVGAKRA